MQLGIIMHMLQIKNTKSKIRQLSFIYSIVELTCKPALLTLNFMLVSSHTEERKQDRTASTPTYIQ